MVADLVREVGGERVTVTQLMGPGVDPHLYAATRDDVRAILSADALFYSGLMLEGKMADTFEKVGRTRPAIAVAESIASDRLLTPPDAGGHPDPHVWMDVALWGECVGPVVEALSALDPANATAFRQRADDYRQRLLELDGYVRGAVGSVPESSRVLVTSHDAFGYFGRAYGMEVLAVQGISTESEAGLERVNALVATLVERDVPAVFVESSVSPKSLRAVVEGCAARGHAMRVGGELYSDATGPGGTHEGTYLGMLDHNATTVSRALGGDAPECGYWGRLASCVEETVP